MDQLVKLSDILQDNYQQQSSHCIQVYPMWTSEFSAKTKRCRFLFWDGQNHIVGIIFFKNEKIKHEIDTCELIKSAGCVVNIQGFKVQENVKQCFRILRGQTKQIILNTCSVRKVTGDDTNSVQILWSNRLNFPFTELEEMKNCKKGTIINITGHVMKVSDVQTLEYTNKEFRLVTIAPTNGKSTEIHGSAEHFQVFGEHKDIIQEGVKYAILNLVLYERKVHQADEWVTTKLFGTFANTTIMRVSSNDGLGSNFQDDWDGFVSPMVPSSGQSEVPTEHVQQSSTNTDQENQIVPSPTGTVKADDTANQHFCSKKTKSFSQPTRIFDNSLLEHKRRKLSNAPLKAKQFPKKKFDFVNNDKPLDVISNITKSITFDDTDEMPCYHMRSRPRGIALIINNVHFPNKKQKVREGSGKDVMHLRDILTCFKFDVTVKQNMKSTDLQNELTSFKQRATENMDACFVAVMSHGREGYIEMFDENEVPLANNIIHQFDNNAFPVMAGKPKIFLIQACKTYDKSQNTVLPIKRRNVVLRDIIEIYATTSGMQALRDRILGSHFIYVLVSTLMDHAHDTDLKTILELVQSRLQNDVILEKEHADTTIHCEWKVHGFTKALYFNPGL